ncbi:Variant surface glycoprotein [Trypanosoma congolense IL3000]|uniref:Variant surface glycoprotein n=1 Tax=Trypanosoma congolense (strain IL3000) TaxID=1068625 RepID=F9W7B3_TRYCI|nr:Variant surface glycoprotein [Trypanosoma congolense IL3000]
MTKVWVTVFWLVMVLVGVYGNEKNHNGDEHDRLCQVLSAAVRVLQSNGVSETLREALRITVFGNRSGGNLDALKETLPGNYDVPNGSNRGIVCGQPPDGLSRTGENPRWPGHSAPHDLVCLCTTGRNGYPFNNVRSVTGSATKLCGQPKQALGGGNGGWDTKSRQEGIQQGTEEIKATWASVTKKCLEPDINGKGLSEALANFLEKLDKKEDPRVEHKDRYQLGVDDADPYPCSGYTKICVMYYNNTAKNYPMPWWLGLENALKTEEKKEEQNKKQDEEERNKNKKNPEKARPKDNSQYPHTHRTATLKSTPPTTEETEQTNHENLSSPIATIEEASSTLITPPYSWLISAVFFI